MPAAIKQFVSARAAGFFSKFYLETVIFIICLILARFLEVTYIIAGFNYLFVCVVIVSVMAVFHLFFFIFPGRSRGLIAVSVIFSLFTAGAFLFADPFSYVRVNYINTTIKLVEQIASNRATLFSDFVPFLYLFALFLFSILFIMYYFSPLKAFLVIFFLLMLLSAGGLDHSLIGFISWCMFFLLSYGIVSIYLRRSATLSMKKTRPGKEIIALSLAASGTIVLTAQIFISVFGISSYLDRFKPVKDALYNTLYRAFNIRTTGFSEGDTILGGSVYPNRRSALEVKSDRLYYLRGDIKTVYTGSLWKKTVRPVIPVNDVNPGPDTVNTLLVKHTGVSSRYFFTPLSARNLSYRTAVFKNRDNIFSVPKNKTVSGTYTVYAAQKRTGPLHFSYTTTDIANDRSLGPYLQLPGTVPDRVFRLVSSLAGESTDPRVRTEKITRFLKSNYAYSQIVDDIPGDRDFVDFFLFSGKKGYCTYFATTATVLFRIAGVPCRYAEGFIMRNNKNSRGSYTVTNDMAHAWCEVLTDPVNNTWAIVDISPQGYSMSDPVSFWSEYYRSAYSRSRALPGVPGGAGRAADTEGGPMDGVFSLLQKNIPFSLYQVFLAVLALFAGAVLFPGIKSLVIQFRLFRGNSNVLFYSYIRRKLNRYGLFLRTTETFEESLDKTFNYDLNRILLPLLNAYASEVFGGSYVAIDRKKTLQRIKAHFKALGYFRYVYIFFIRG